MILKSKNAFTFIGYYKDYDGNPFCLVCYSALPKNNTGNLVKRHYRENHEDIISIMALLDNHRHITWVQKEEIPNYEEWGLNK